MTVKFANVILPEKKNKPLYNVFSGNIMGIYVIKEGFCLGTKECDVCNCQGNKNKCDFY